MRALRGLLILQYTINNIKCKALWVEKHIDDHFVSLKDINKLRAAMVKKEADECKTQYKNCSNTTTTII